MVNTTITNHALYPLIYGGLSQKMVGEDGVAEDTEGEGAGFQYPSRRGVQIEKQDALISEASSQIQQKSRSNF